MDLSDCYLDFYLPRHCAVLVIAMIVCSDIILRFWINSSICAALCDMQIHHSWAGCHCTQKSFWAVTHCAFPPWCKLLGHIYIFSCWLFNQPTTLRLIECVVFIIVYWTSQVSVLTLFILLIPEMLKLLGVHLALRVQFYV